MLLMGDEAGRSRRGNNNAYCQDSEIGWFNWNAIEGEGKDLLEFTKMLIRLRHEHIVFRRSRFFHGSVIPGTDVKDVTWLRPDGQEMTPADRENPIAKAILVLLSGEAGLTYLTEEGEPELDDTFVMILNASHVDVEVTLPDRAADGRCMSRSTPRPRMAWGTRPARSVRPSTRWHAPLSFFAARPRNRRCDDQRRKGFDVGEAVCVILVREPQDLNTPAKTGKNPSESFA